MSKPSEPQVPAAALELISVHYDLLATLHALGNVASGKKLWKLKRPIVARGTGSDNNAWPFRLKQLEDAKLITVEWMSQYRLTPKVIRLTAAGLNALHGQRGQCAKECALIADAAEQP